MDSFAYMVSDDQQQVLALRDYALEAKRQGERLQELEELISRDRYLKPSHRNIRIGFVGKAATFIPERLFNPLEKQNYLRQLTDIGPETNVRADDLLHYHAKIVYAIDRPVESLLRNHFAGGRIFHIHSALLSGLWEVSIPQGTERLIANVHDRSAQVVLLRGRELVFANLFGYESAKDFLYFVMLAYDQFNLDPEKTPLQLCGRLVQDSEIYRLLYRYVRNLQFLQPPAFLRLGEKLGKEPRHFYFDLLSLVFCA